ADVAHGGGDVELVEQLLFGAEVVVGDPVRRRAGAAGAERGAGRADVQLDLTVVAPDRSGARQCESRRAGGRWLRPGVLQCQRGAAERQGAAYSELVRFAARGETGVK